VGSLCTIDVHAEKPVWKCGTLVLFFEFLCLNSEIVGYMDRKLPR
jgi:hypothetical protein